MSSFANVKVPDNGEKISIEQGVLQVPDHPIMPYIEGDGIGPDIWRAAHTVFDTAVERAYGGRRRISWMEVYAGEKAFKQFGSWLPEDTIHAFREFLVGIKGPLTTPVGGGIRSLNVALRKDLDLYTCLRPVRYFDGLPSPVRHPEDVDLVIFRENTEDLYSGIEFEAAKPETERFSSLLKDNFPAEYAKVRFPQTSGFGIKPISREGTDRLVRAAMRWALENHRRNVTLVHKGNIMKYTEGAFRKWGYELAEREFGDRVYTWAQWNRTKEAQGETVANAEQDRAVAAGKLIVKDMIADIIFQETLICPADYDVIATMNLNGDYLSDALAAQVGGIGIAPGGNINYETGVAVFEATHGTAPKYADKNMANPSSVVLSGEMMFRYLGWNEAADLIIHGLERTIAARAVTFDFHRQMDGARLVSTSEFGQAIVANMERA
jgi:isocitrate dehydrogenase